MSDHPTDPEGLVEEPPKAPRRAIRSRATARIVLAMYVLALLGVELLGHLRPTEPETPLIRLRDLFEPSRWMGTLALTGLLVVAQFAALGLLAAGAAGGAACQGGRPSATQRLLVRVASASVQNLRGRESAGG